MWITISLQGIFCLKHFSCLMSIVFLTNKMVVHRMKNQRFLCSNWKLRLSSSSSRFLESATYLSIVCDCVNQISTWHRRICLFVCLFYLHYGVYMHAFMAIWTEYFATGRVKTSAGGRRCNRNAIGIKWNGQSNRCITAGKNIWHVHNWTKCNTIRIKYKRKSITCTKNQKS